MWQNDNVAAVVASVVTLGVTAGVTGTTDGVTGGVGDLSRLPCIQFDINIR